MYSKRINIGNFLHLLLVGAVYLGTVTGSDIKAACGLHVCPIPVVTKGTSPTGTASGMPSQIWLESRYASFDIGGKGGYMQTALAGIYEHRWFRAGGVLPVIYLNSPQGETTGLGNSVAFGEFYLVNGAQTRLSVGSQLETPTGNSDKGLGANHFMAVPYVNFAQILEHWRFAVQAGFQQTLGASHGHAGSTAVLYVNPHENSEIIARAMTSYTWLGIWSAEVNTSLRQVTVHDAVGNKTFFDVGTAFRATIGNGFALRAGVDIPVTSTARYLYQTYLGCFYYF